MNRGAWQPAVHQSVQFSHLVIFDSFQPHGLQHARFLCPSPIPRACSNSCSSSQRCHPNHLILCHPLLLLPSISPSSRGFSNESVFLHQVAKVLELQLQHQSFHGYSGLISLGWVGLVSLQSKGLSRVFSNTTVQKHQFFGTQLSLWSNSHIHT